MQPFFSSSIHCDTWQHMYMLYGKPMVIGGPLYQYYTIIAFRDILYGIGIYKECALSWSSLELVVGCCPPKNHEINDDCDFLCVISRVWKYCWGFDYCASQTCSSCWSICTSSCPINTPWGSIRQRVRNNFSIIVLTIYYL